MEDGLAAVRDAIVDMREDEITGLVLACLDRGRSPIEVIENAVAPGLEIVGRRFEEGEFFLADLILAGEAVGRAMAVLRDRIPPGGANRGRVIRHRAGDARHRKRVVGMMPPPGLRGHRSALTCRLKNRETARDGATSGSRLHHHGRKHQGGGELMTEAGFSG